MLALQVAAQIAAVLSIGVIGGHHALLGFQILLLTPLIPIGIWLGWSGLVRVQNPFGSVLVMILGAGITTAALGRIAWMLFGGDPAMPIWPG